MPSVLVLVMTKLRDQCEVDDPDDELALLI
jgi:hypothetical protein